MHARSIKVYSEDVVGLEKLARLRAAERSVGDSAEVSIRSDAAGIQMRRIIATLSRQRHPEPVEGQPRSSPLHHPR